MGQWQEIISIKTNENALHNFCNAVEILLNKPHVVNKRLCGKNILHRERLLGLTRLTTKQLEILIGEAKRKSQTYDRENIESFVEKIIGSLEVGVCGAGPDAKKFRLTSEHHASKCFPRTCQTHVPLANYRSPQAFFFSKHFYLFIFVLFLFCLHKGVKLIMNLSRAKHVFTDEQSVEASHRLPASLFTLKTWF